VHKKPVAAGASDDFMTQVSGYALGFVIPEDDPAFPVGQIQADLQVLGDVAKNIRIVNAHGSHSYLSAGTMFYSALPKYHPRRRSSSTDLHGCTRVQQDAFSNR
jgi:hypothetical protein